MKREQLEELIFGKEGARRFTQDSPVLPDVWIEYGQDPDAVVDLLLTPNRESLPGRVAHVIEERLVQERKILQPSRGRKKNRAGSDIAYNQSTVAIRLYFDELIRVVLPLTPWWNNYVEKERQNNINLFLQSSTYRTEIAKILKEESRGLVQNKIPSQLIWMMKIVGTIALSKGKEIRKDTLKYYGAIVDSCARLMQGLNPVERENQALIFSVTQNRPATSTIWRSAPAVKADAAKRLFEISCKNLVWAVVDSGVDATHPAFRCKDANNETCPEPFKKGKNQTRVLATYDFTRIRLLLARDQSLLERLPAHLKKRLEKHPGFIQDLRDDLEKGHNINWEIIKPLLEIPHQEGEYKPPLTVNGHGTHVAGILAADWAKEDRPKYSDDADYDLKGLCPDIRLYDLRVLDEEGRGDEFSVIAALQFIRYLNAHKDYMMVHGVNLSLSIRHDVANYACGYTPVCEESERLASAGVIVVAAAGNDGYLQYMTPGGSFGGYRYISITDPGNAEGVITVGSTHRDRAHAYGVSYFSSRGPTGDGRAKPDLVAPGEKIVSTVPMGSIGNGQNSPVGEGSKRMDGTSMAAPHVSGAAALLIARYPELIGRPARVKEILCRTATDLGRERYFQGSGMVDILRAMQSV